jgi:hypothetical protein
MEYIVGVWTYIEYYKGNKITIADPYFMITNKSSKKKRDKKPVNKQDAHHLRVRVDKPIGLFRIIYSALNIYLNNFDYVIFVAYNDSMYKRMATYKNALNKMGFEYHTETKHYHIFKHPDAILVDVAYIKKYVENHME